MMVAICCKGSLFREAFAAVVRNKGHEVACCVSVLDDAIRESERFCADVLLLDSSLSDEDSLAQLRSRPGRGRAPRVLLLTSSGKVAPNSAAGAALEAGLAEGVFDHASALVSLERAVGGQSCPPSPSRRTLAHPRRADSLLTAREYEVIGLLLAGRPTDSIASNLGVSRSTVHSHVQSILRKLGARNRIEAVNIYLCDTSRNPSGAP